MVVFESCRFVALPVPPYVRAPVRTITTYLLAYSHAYTYTIRYNTLYITIDAPSFFLVLVAFLFHSYSPARSAIAYDSSCRADLQSPPFCTCRDGVGCPASPSTPPSAPPNLKLALYLYLELGMLKTWAALLKRWPAWPCSCRRRTRRAVALHRSVLIVSYRSVVLSIGLSYQIELNSIVLLQRLSAERCCILIVSLFSIVRLDLKSSEHQLKNNEISSHSFYVSSNRNRLIEIN